MKRNRNVKIVATVGPASSDPKNLERLFLDGVDVFRLNFSHGLCEKHAKVCEAIRAIGKKHDAFPTILADLQGPKLRIGSFGDNKIVLQKDDVFQFDSNPAVGDSKRVCLPHPEILEATEVGTILLLDDGRLKFEVVSRRRDFAEARTIVGGELSGGKGVSVPNLKLAGPILTEKDRADLDFALDIGVDWVVISMVQCVEDIEKARKIINGRAGLITKLETRLAAENFEPIVEASDAIMFGRGDLAVEIGFENVPSVQRDVVKACRRLGRPVIVATQMLESMITSPTPTRAEASDVANAVYQEADAVMLSAESAVGQYPFEAVKTMDKIIKKTEFDMARSADESPTPRKTTLDAICSAAKEAATYSDANAIVLFSKSLATALRCSRTRPRAPIIFVTDSGALACQVGLCRGVYSAIEKKEFDVGQARKTARSIVAERKFASAGDNIVILNDMSGNYVEICKVDTNNGIV
jgi:pyruvate kinase